MSEPTRWNIDVPTPATDTGIFLSHHSYPRNSNQPKKATLRAHDADLAELVGRTNVHIFLVPR